VVIAFATTPLLFAIGFAFLGINFGVSWPAFNALVAAVTTGETRQQYFGINFALINLGIGVGGVIGGFYADVSDPTTFTVIFLADAASMLVPILLLLGPLRHVQGLAAQPSDDDAGTPGSYLAILRQPAVVWLTALTFLGTFVGYGQIEAGLPAFARSVSEVSTRVIGFGFAVNTATIVLLQFVVLRRISGRRRTRVLVAMTVLWAVAWLVLGSICRLIRWWCSWSHTGARGRARCFPATAVGTCLRPHAHARHRRYRPWSRYRNGCGAGPAALARTGKRRHGLPDPATRPSPCWSACPSGTGSHPDAPG
jgi:hypothetical protein